MSDIQNITALRMQRQCLVAPANEMEYISLYRDTSPVQNVYWCGFGEPPSITFRSDFNDLEYNRNRQRSRTIVKGRFQNGNVGFIEASELELFAGLYRRSIDKPVETQDILLDIIEREGPMNIGLMKEMTGLLVKEITPALHKLQIAFLIFEDQNDGEWDRGWYKFNEMFPDVNISKYTRHEALKIILLRFSYRQVCFNTKMAKSFYRLPEKEIKNALDELVREQILVVIGNNYMLKSDYELSQKERFDIPKSVFVLHRNDFLVKSNEYWLSEKYRNDEFDVLQYILIDGEFKGALMGHFKNGPYILEDIVLDLQVTESIERREEIIEAVYQVNNREHSPIERYNGMEII